MLESNLWVLIEYHTAGCSLKICWSMPPLIKSIWIFLQKSCSDLKNLTTAVTKLTNHTVSLKILSLLVSISQTLCKHSLCYIPVRDYCIVLLLCTVLTMWGLTGTCVSLNMAWFNKLCDIIEDSLHFLKDGQMLF